MAAKSYRDLEVWRKAMTLVEKCFLATKKFPREEMFGLTSQIRRAAVSVPANIAEGQARQLTKVFLNALSVARGSLAELETHLILSQRIGLLTEVELNPLISLADEVGKMISGLRRNLEDREYRP